MTNIDYKFNNNDIIICPYEVKKHLVFNKDDILVNIKFIDKQELITNLHFDYSLNAITYLKEKYNYSYSNAKEILDNLKKVNIFNRCSKKVNEIFDIYDDLKTNNLLEFNPYYKYLFKDKNVYVIGYSSFDMELKYLLESLGCKYEFVTLDSVSKNYQKTLKFNDIYTEVEALFNEICKLVESGISLNNIYLYSYSGDFNYLIDRYVRYLNFKLDNNRYMLNKLPIYRQFIEGISEYSVNGLNDSFNKLTFEFGKDEIRKLIVLVRDVKFDKELLDFLSKTIFVKGEKYDQEISVIDDFTYLNENDYLFIVGFNYGDYPKVRKDTDFFSDKEKEVLEINTSASLRDIEKDLLKSLINSSSNIYISYHEVDGKNKFNVSQIANELNLELIEGKVDNKRYSKKLAELEVANLIDKKRVYGEESDYINTFTKDEISYNSFDNKFNATLPYNDNEIEISYSQIENYNECHFCYYLDRILKISENDDTFFTRFGTMAHQILEDSLTKKIDESNIYNYISSYYTEKKDIHFASKLLKQILEVINKNNNYIKISSLKESEAEKDITYNFDSKTKITGKIDKLIYDRENKQGIIVDYKTGQFQFDKEKIKYGIGMQLVIYSLLLENSDIDSFYKDLEILGIYIQKVLFDYTKPEELHEEQHYLLNGITIGGGEDVAIVDPLNEEGKKSKVIKKITYKKDGKPNSDSYSVISDKEAFLKLKEEAKKQIALAIQGIRNNRFDISPIKYGRDKAHCEYCHYSDICYKRAKDTIYIDPEGGKKQ